MNDTILLKIMFLLLGGVMVGIYFISGLYNLYKNSREKKYTCKTYGKVIYNIKRAEKGTDKLRDSYSRWYSLCEYSVGETKCVRETKTGTIEPRKIGTIVTIYYNPNNCHEAYIMGDNNRIAKAIVAFIIAIIIIGFIFFITISIS